MIATTTIRIDHATLPDPLNTKNPDATARIIEGALREEGIVAEASDLFSHLKIEIPTAQLAAASTVLASLQFI
jgi:hypothetical protein